MKWISAAFQVVSEFLSLGRYGRHAGICFGVFLMLVAIPFNSMVLMVIGGVIASLSAFWPNRQV